MAVGAIRRILIWLRVLRAYILTFSGVKCKILDAEQTVNEILSGKSLIRFGDGEFGIYSGRDIHYQPYSNELRKEFDAIKQDFEIDGVNCRYILAVPKKYMQCSGLELGNKRVLVSSWSDSRLFFKKNFNRELIYGDSFLFEKRNKHIYSKLWTQSEDKRKILFIHNNPEYAESFGKAYNRDVIFYQCPSYDSFRFIDTMLSDIILKIAGHQLNREDVQIVISAGPAGKVLVFHLSKAGYQCIDAGHCWDDPLES